VICRWFCLPRSRDQLENKQIIIFCVVAITFLFSLAISGPYAKSAQSGEPVLDTNRVLALFLQNQSFRMRQAAGLAEDMGLLVKMITPGNPTEQKTAEDKIVERFRLPKIVRAHRGSNQELSLLSLRNRPFFKDNESYNRAVSVLVVLATFQVEVQRLEGFIRTQSARFLNLSREESLNSELREKVKVLASGLSVVSINMVSGVLTRWRDKLWSLFDERTLGFKTALELRQHRSEMLQEMEKPGFVTPQEVQVATQTEECLKQLAALDLEATMLPFDFWSYDIGGADAIDPYNTPLQRNSLGQELIGDGFAQLLPTAMLARPGEVPKLYLSGRERVIHNVSHTVEARVNEKWHGWRNSSSGTEERPILYVMGGGTVKNGGATNLCSDGLASVGDPFAPEEL
jgi:hypothetical protein